MITFVSYIFYTLQLIIFASVAMQWLSLPLTNPLVRWIHNITEPVYNLIRGFSNIIPGPFDWAPMICLFIIITLHRIIMSMLLG